MLRVPPIAIFDSALRETGLWCMPMRALTPNDGPDRLWYVLIWLVHLNAHRAVRSCGDNMRFNILGVAADKFDAISLSPVCAAEKMSRGGLTTLGFK